MIKTETRITDDLKKFLASSYAEKLLLTAKLNGQENFKYGKAFYKVNWLLGLIKENKKSG